MALSKGFAAAAAPATERLERTRPLLLLVDDEKEILSALADQLRRTCDVVTAQSGAEALEILRDRDVSAIVSDQRMPEMTGAEFLARACVMKEEAVRILLTGYSDLDAVVNAVNNGKIYFYLAKPWDPFQLEGIVGMALEHSKLIRERHALIDELKRANQELERRVSERTAELALRNRQLEDANRTITELSRRDPLTGLLNRRALDEALSREAARAARDGGSLTAVMLDIDHFKQVNDTLGHAVGDTVLADIGQLLTDSVRPYDLAARYGGEEFVLLLPQTALPEGIEVAERLRRQVAARDVPDDRYRVTVSLGVAALRSGEAPELLLARADAALYRAKAGGRDRVEADADPGTANVPAGSLGS